MYRFNVYDSISEGDACDHLAREFPRVPKRIIVAVLAAYRAVTPSIGLAEQTARDRLRDACSI